MSGSAGRNAVTSLALNRIAYGINWSNFGSIFPYVAAEYKLDVSSLGLISAGQILAGAALQVPGGVIASKLGARRALLLGMSILAVAVMSTGLATEVLQLLLLRFLVGVGMGIAWSPGVILITRYFKRGAEGVGVGIFNSATGIGSVLAIFGWAFLPLFVGWRVSTWTGGGLLLLTILLVYIPIPPEKGVTNLGVNLKITKEVLSDKWLNMVSASEEDTSILASVSCFPYER